MFITNNDSKEHKDEIKDDDRNKAQWCDVYEENEKMIHV